MVKDFSENWNQSTIRNLVANNCYPEFYKHPDLRALCITNDEPDINKADYEELTFIVPTKWLKKFCKNYLDVQDINVFLREEYTSKESKEIFTAALIDRQVVMVDFI